MDWKTGTMIFFIGYSMATTIIIVFQMRHMGDEINIRKQVQRNRKSPNNKQEYQATQETKDRRLFKRKNLKNEK